MLPRRWFLSRLGIGVAGLGGGVASAAPQAQAAPAGGAWKPARHAQDDWLDQVPGSHRLIFDTTTPQGFGQVLLFVNNYLNANKNGYNLQDADLAVVVVVRHQSVSYAFTDAMWAKYGAGLAQHSGMNDPNTKQPPTVNIYNSSSYGTTLLSRGVMLDGLLKRGLQLAVCDVATGAAAGMAATATGGDRAAIKAELMANRVANSHMVPAGIVAVNRAQERGYAFAYAAGV